MLDGVRGVIFDFGWTLAEWAGPRPWREAVELAMAALCDELGSAADSEKATNYERSALHILGTIDVAKAKPGAIDAAWAEISRRNGPYARAAPSAAIETFGESLTEHWRPYRESLPVLDALSRRGYLLGLVSDVASPARHWDRLVQRFGFGHYLRATAYSEGLGSTKPDPAGLLSVADSLGVKPANCLFIGDTPEKDVDAAHAAGAVAVWIRRRPEVSLGDRRPALTVDSFKELLAYLPGSD